MTKRLMVAFSLLLLMLVSVGFLSAEEMLSRPEIDGYATPENEFPGARATNMEYVDVVLLVVALSTASYFSLVSRSRRGLFVLAIGSLLWFGFLREGCVCSVGSIQNVALALGDPSYGISFAILAFFTLPLVFALFVGRTFCSSVCPLGAVQELVTLRPIKVPVWLNQTLGLLPYFYLGAAVLFAVTDTAFIICEYDPFVAFFRLSGSVNMFVLGGCFLVIGIYVGRPYCRYLCPYGALLKIAAKASRWQLRIAPEECINCRLCEDVCPYGAIYPPTVEQSDKARVAARGRISMLLALAPVIVFFAAWVGAQVGVPLSRLHPEARLAERVRLEETGKVEGTTDASDVFHNTGRPREELYASALGLHDQFATAGFWLGAWIGLVVAVKLIHTSLRRRRTEFTADRGACVSCGRCFWYCPGEQVRLGLIEGVEEAIEVRAK